MILDSKYMYRFFLKKEINTIKGPAKISFHYLGKRTR